MNFETFPRSEFRDEKEAYKSRTAKAMAIAVALSFPNISSALDGDVENADKQLPSIGSPEFKQAVRGLHKRSKGYFSPAGTMGEYISGQGENPLSRVSVWYEGEGNEAIALQELSVEWLGDIYNGANYVMHQFSADDVKAEPPFSGVVFFAEGGNANAIKAGDFNGMISFDADYIQAKMELGIEESLFCISMHETAHRVDDQFQLLDTLLDEEDGAFIHVWQELAEDDQFMESLRDGIFRENFCPEDAGHPEGSEYELFATFVVAMQAPDVVERVDELESRYHGFRDKFLRVAQGIEYAMNKNKKLPKTIPFRGSLEKVISILEYKESLDH